MKILKQILIIFSLCLFGELIAYLLPFAFPSSVISLLLLFILLLCRILKPEQIAQVSDFLLSSMAMFFIPAGVAIMEKYELIKDSLLPLIIITFSTTIITFAVTAYTVLFFIKLMKKREEKRNG